MVNKEDRIIFEENLSGRKKNLVVIPPERQLFLPTLRRQARDTPPTPGWPTLQGTAVSPSALHQCTRWLLGPRVFSSEMSPFQAQWPLPL